MIIQYLYQNTGINLSDEQQSKLESYCDFLLEENEKYNLTAITEREAVWEKHFADSILGSVLTPQNAAVCDVGCGAGSPLSPSKLPVPTLPSRWWTACKSGWSFAALSATEWA